jgi:ribosomal protein S18 acetylase RimI-like enzyme
MTTPTSPLPIRPLSPSRSSDPALISAIVSLINLVFDETEGDLLVAGHQRTNTAEITRLVSAGELHGTFTTSGDLIGVVRLFRVDQQKAESDETARGTGEDAAIAADTKTGSEASPASDPANIWSFGMLSVHPSQRGTGLGRRLVRYAEEEAARKGGREMEIVLLVPADGPPHAFKLFLSAWYARIGYVATKSMSPEEFLPHLENVFSRKCLFEASRKRLL